MSVLLQRWLEEDVGLSRRVSSIQKDFANGYLFGELLWRLDHITAQQFAEYRQGSDVPAVTHNYQLLGPALSRAGIKLSRDELAAILRQTPGHAVQVVYRLKALQHKTPSKPLSPFQKRSDPQRARMAEARQDAVSWLGLASKHPTLQEAYDWMRHRGYEQRHRTTALQHTASQLEEKQTTVRQRQEQDLHKIRASRAEHDRALEEGLVNWRRNRALDASRKITKLLDQCSDQVARDTVRRQRWQQESELARTDIQRFERARVGVRARGESQPTTSSADRSLLGSDSPGGSPMGSGGARVDRQRRRRKLFVDQLLVEKSIERSSAVQGSSMALVLREAVREIPPPLAFQAGATCDSPVAVASTVQPVFTPPEHKAAEAVNFRQQMRLRHRAVRYEDTRDHTRMSHMLDADGRLSRVTRSETLHLHDAPSERREHARRQARNLRFCRAIARSVGQLAEQVATFRERGASSSGPAPPRLPVRVFTDWKRCMWQSVARAVDDAHVDVDVAGTSNSDGEAGLERRQSARRRRQRAQDALRDLHPSGLVSTLPRYCDSSSDEEEAMDDAGTDGTDPSEHRVHLQHEQAGQVASTTASSTTTVLGSDPIDELRSQFFPPADADAVAYEQALGTRGFFGQPNNLQKVQLLERAVRNEVHALKAEVSLSVSTLPQLLPEVREFLEQGQARDPLLQRFSQALQSCAADPREYSGLHSVPRRSFFCMVQGSPLSAPGAVAAALARPLNFCLLDAHRVLEGCWRFFVAHLLARAAEAAAGNAGGAAGRRGGRKPIQSLSALVTAVLKDASPYLQLGGRLHRCVIKNESVPTEVWIRLMGDAVAQVSVRHGIRVVRTSYTGTAAASATPSSSPAQTTQTLASRARRTAGSGPENDGGAAGGGQAVVCTREVLDLQACRVEGSPSIFVAGGSPGAVRLPGSQNTTTTTTPTPTTTTTTTTNNNNNNNNSHDQRGAGAGSGGDVSNHAESPGQNAAASLQWAREVCAGGHSLTAVVPPLAQPDVPCGGCFLLSVPSDAELVSALDRWLLSGGRDMPSGRRTSSSHATPGGRTRGKSRAGSSLGGAGGAMTLLHDIPDPHSDLFHVVLDLQAPEEVQWAAQAKNKNKAQRDAPDSHSPASLGPGGRGRQRRGSASGGGGLGVEVDPRFPDLTGTRVSVMLDPRELWAQVEDAAAAGVQVSSAGQSSLHSSSSLAPIPSPSVVVEQVRPGGRLETVAAVAPSPRHTQEEAQTSLSTALHQWMGELLIGVERVALAVKWDLGKRSIVDAAEHIFRPGGGGGGRGNGTHRHGGGAGGRAGGERKNSSHHGGSPQVPSSVDNTVDDPWSGVGAAFTMRWTRQLEQAHEALSAPLVSLDRALTGPQLRVAVAQLSQREMTRRTEMRKWVAVRAEACARMHELCSGGDAQSESTADSVPIGPVIWQMTVSDREVVCGDLLPMLQLLYQHGKQLETEAGLDPVGMAPENLHTSTGRVSSADARRAATLVSDPQEQGVSLAYLPLLVPSTTAGPVVDALWTVQQTHRAVLQESFARLARTRGRHRARLLQLEHAFQRFLKRQEPDLQEVLGAYVDDMVADSLRDLSVWKEGVRRMEQAVWVGGLVYPNTDPLDHFLPESVRNRCQELSSEVWARVERQHSHNRQIMNTLRDSSWLQYACSSLFVHYACVLQAEFTRHCQWRRVVEQVFAPLLTGLSAPTQSGGQQQDVTYPHSNVPDSQESAENDASVPFARIMVASRPEERVGGDASASGDLLEDQNSIHALLGLTSVTEGALGVEVSFRQLLRNVHALVGVRNRGGSAGVYSREGSASSQRVAWTDNSGAPTLSPQPKTSDGTNERTNDRTAEDQEGSWMAQRIPDACEASWGGLLPELRRREARASWRPLVLQQLRTLLHQENELYRCRVRWVDQACRHEVLQLVRSLQQVCWPRLASWVGLSVRGANRAITQLDRRVKSGLAQVALHAIRAQEQNDRAQRVRRLRRARLGRLDYLTPDTLDQCMNGPPMRLMKAQLGLWGGQSLVHRDICAQVAAGGAADPHTFTTVQVLKWVEILRSHASRSPYLVGADTVVNLFVRGAQSLEVGGGDGPNTASQRAEDVLPAWFGRCQGQQVWRALMAPWVLPMAGSRAGDKNVQMLYWRSLILSMLLPDRLTAPTAAEALQMVHEFLGVRLGGPQSSSSGVSAMTVRNGKNRRGSSGPQQEHGTVKWAQWMRMRCWFEPEGHLGSSDTPGARDSLQLTCSAECPHRQSETGRAEGAQGEKNEQAGISEGKALDLDRGARSLLTAICTHLSAAARIKLVLFHAFSKTTSTDVSPLLFNMNEESHQSQQRPVNTQQDYCPYRELLRDLLTQLDLGTRQLRFGDLLAHLLCCDAHVDPTEDEETARSLQNDTSSSTTINTHTTSTDSATTAEAKDVHGAALDRVQAYLGVLGECSVEAGNHGQAICADLRKCSSVLRKFPRALQRQSMHQQMQSWL